MPPRNSPAYSGYCFRTREQSRPATDSAAAESLLLALAEISLCLPTA